MVSRYYLLLYNYFKRTREKIEKGIKKEIYKERKRKKRKERIRKISLCGLMVIGVSIRMVRWE